MTTREKRVIYAATFQPGDEVELVSGSLNMTVIGTCPDCGNVEVAYANSKGNVVFHEFPAVCLTLAGAS